MKFKCSRQEITAYARVMDEQLLPYTIEQDKKGSYLVTGLNEEEFMEIVLESEQKCHFPGDHVAALIC